MSLTEQLDRLAAIRTGSVPGRQPVSEYAARASTAAISTRRSSARNSRREAAPIRRTRRSARASTGPRTDHAVSRERACSRRPTASPSLRAQPASCSKPSRSASDRFDSTGCTSAISRISIRWRGSNRSTRAMRAVLDRHQYRPHHGLRRGRTGGRARRQRRQDRATLRRAAGRRRATSGTSRTSTSSTSRKSSTRSTVSSRRRHHPDSPLRRRGRSLPLLREQMPKHLRRRSSITCALDAHAPP